MNKKNIISQDELDTLLSINGFLSKDENQKTDLITEIHEAILDSGRLSLEEWTALRDKLSDIERLIPHIELIIQLKRTKD